MKWNFENSYTSLPSELYTRQSPVPVKSASLVILNQALINQLGLGAYDETKYLAILAGNALPDGADSIAQAYSGHQFGHFNQLGDGRALLLGEHVTPSKQRYDIQLKGSGPTPYSRRGDGRAALGPMLREYIISEAMHAFGIPTTRSLAVVTTGEPVFRESVLPGAILTRVASSHIRVGTFQFAAILNRKDVLQQLADYTIARHFPEIRNSINPYDALIREVCTRQASLISQWLNIGFIHGVMNTDNMALSGETIDYGPCAFMDAYDPETVFSSIDRNGRYAYDQQPGIAHWNLTRFAESLLPLLDEKTEAAVELAKASLQVFSDRFNFEFHDGLAKKFGFNSDTSDNHALVEKFMLLMKEHSADYTNSFRGLCQAKLPDDAFFNQNAVKAWYGDWKARILNQGKPMEQILIEMKKVNPAIIPRNHLVEEVLRAAEDQNDFAKLHRLLEALADPFSDAEKFIDFTQPPNPAQRVYQTFCGT